MYFHSYRIRVNTVYTHVDKIIVLQFQLTGLKFSTKFTFISTFTLTSEFYQIFQHDIRSTFLIKALRGNTGVWGGFPSVFCASVGFLFVMCCQQVCVWPGVSRRSPRTPLSDLQGSNTINEKSPRWEHVFVARFGCLYLPLRWWETSKQWAARVGWPPTLFFYPPLWPQSSTSSN